MERRSLNVILFGETGSGKSSVINLLAGKEVARTSPDIDGCTTAYQPYPLIVNGVSYTVWDTVGLDEPMVGNTGYLRSIEQVCKLVRDLTKAGGVDLLLFCHRQGRITTITQKNYALLYEVACQESVPIAVVITHLELEERMEDWWDQNAEIFDQRDIKFCGHACVTTLSKDPKMQESRGAIERMLKTLDSNERHGMPAELVKGKDLVGILRERCGLREDHARSVARILAE
jgi:tRNA U34 5-carboxymethylaminomethyl modifying GTPase MnmE/TrmE